MAKLNAIRSHVNNDNSLLDWIYQAECRLFLTSQQVTLGLIQLHQILFNDDELTVKLVENGPLLINDALRICLTRLNQFTVDQLNQLTNLLKKMNSEFNSDKIVDLDLVQIESLKYFTHHSGIRFEFQRREALHWLNTLPDVRKNIECVSPCQLDRLVTLRAEFEEIERDYARFSERAVMFANHMGAADLVDYIAHMKFVQAMLKEASHSRDENLENGQEKFKKSAGKLFSTFYAI
jgi:hypothetical protein